MKFDRLPRHPLPTAPLAEERPRTLQVHGVSIRDHYAWLKAENWQAVLEDPAALDARIGQHLERENAYTAQVMRGTGALRKRLASEMRGRLKEDDADLPRPDGPFSYYTRYRADGQYSLICRQPRAGGPEEILIDGDREAAAYPYFEFGETAHSPDHRLVAWAADTKGSEFFTIRVRDLGAGRDLPDEILRTEGEAVWIGDGSGFYYVALDDTLRPSCIRRHLIGRPFSEDETVYEESDPGFFLSVGRTQSGAFVIVSAGDHETSEVWLLDRFDRQATPRLVEPRTPQLQYDVEHHGDELVIVTNADGAEDFKVVTAPLATPGRAHWRDLVPYRPGVMILSQTVLARHHVRLEREEARPRIVIRDMETGREVVISSEEEAYSLGMEPGFEFNTNVVRYHHSSLTRPCEATDYEIPTGRRIVRKRQEVPSGHDPDLYVARRFFATASDGEQVPVSLVHRRDLALDGSAPCFLHGYGAYGSATGAAFKTNPLSLVDRGFVYAIAHVRGGTEKGWRWYLEGKREKKPNTFTDFIACAEALIGAGYTGRGRIVAHGGSAGGMLMGAVANLAPALFAGIVADVPFVDVLNTMLDKDLPLTPPEWPEWGNPGADEAAFRTILSYSPYDNVRPQAYPAILALGGLTDPRVTYWEPAKWVARLRATMTGGGPILLKINMEAGHGGAAGRLDELEEVALCYAFAIKAVQGFGEAA